MRVWIIGARGMLGSTIQELCQRHHLSYAATGSHEADVTDLNQLFTAAEKIVPTHLIHCAAFTDVDQAEQAPQLAHAINEIGAGHVAEVAKAMKAKLLHISTDYVFDGTSGRPYLETDACAPVNVYGKSKWEGEKRVIATLPSACIVRASWFFGKKGKNFISTLLDRLEKNEVIPVVSDQASCLTYCWDLAEALLKMLDSQGIFHFANAGGESRYEIAKQVLEIVKESGRKVRCQRIEPVLSSHFPSRVPRPAYSVLNTQKITRYLGSPPRPWQEAFKEYLKDV